MKPHPRLRETIKWGGAAVTVLLGVMWIGSGWIRWYWIGGRIPYAVQLDSGAIAVGPSGNALPRTETRIHDFDLGHWPVISRQGIAIELWIPAVAVFGITLWAWRLDTLAHRRARLNRCPKCNYDRAGINANAVCPECGSVAP